ncbi:zinc transporter ZntB [Microbulbifer agarilyticus]|uniref:zinc transporter ZntB n=1 Tax=Microbulbifer agarilyticus TaxID=260552 RepID=UPI001C987C46|nr:zinc transporter ZntB [Microbulbifer agarilyticus]MBY6191542.1 zinc transporter ZntB [Microbulbifer agarilyticus]MBY6212550.1 zinc transporter ZntB [Microbulbifer agarilyticus]MCA0894165.1 zinc transporter ZntB [Microbulbifer agarilyticus]
MNNGLIHAYLLDGKGGARNLTWAEVDAWKPAQGSLWVHLDYSDAQAQSWVSDTAQLDPLVAAALLTEETRPRSTAVGDGLLIALRGVNLDPESEQEDLVSLRLWVEESRIITTRKRPLLAVRDLREQLERGRGPTTSAGVLFELAGLLVWHMGHTVDSFEDAMDGLEDRVVAGDSADLRSDLAVLRKQTITLRRYLTPQRDALTHLMAERRPWISKRDQMQLREVSDRLLRHIEDIDEIRDRAAVTQEELASRISEQLNNRMYLLSIIAAVFLPLSFFTGLLGVNVGGIPGSENPQAFIIFSVLLVVTVVLQLVAFRWRKWL